jgi:hypothetical protein
MEEHVFFLVDINVPIFGREGMRGEEAKRRRWRG